MIKVLGILAMIPTLFVAIAANAGFFGGKDSVVEVDRDVKYKQQQENYAANKAAIEKIIAGKEAEVRARGEELLVEYKEEHRRQSEGFKFEARRWGDYIEISMRRDQDGEQSKSVSLLLSDLSTAELKPGHAPDKEGQVRFSQSIKNAEGSFGGSSGDGWYYKADGKQISVDMYDIIDPSLWEVIPNYVTLPKRDFVILPLPPATASTCVSQFSSAIGCNVGVLTYYDIGLRGSFNGFTNFPRPAEDDKIVFSKAGVTIFAPAGKGREVLEKIMLASGKDASK